MDNNTKRIHNRSEMIVRDGHIRKSNCPLGRKYFSGDGREDGNSFFW